MKGDGKQVLGRGLGPADRSPPGWRQRDIVGLLVQPPLWVLSRASDPVLGVGADPWCLSGSYQQKGKEVGGDVMGANN